MTEVQLATDWGYEQFFECPICTAIVREPEKHLLSHEDPQDRMVRKLKEILENKV